MIYLEVVVFIEVCEFLEVRKFYVDNFLKLLRYIDIGIVIFYMVLLYFNFFILWFLFVF